MNNRFYNGSVQVFQFVLSVFSLITIHRNSSNNNNGSLKIDHYRFAKYTPANIMAKQPICAAEIFSFASNPHMMATIGMA
jgi:hypothetical protein